jgi:hypothetical protein
MLERAASVGRKYLPVRVFGMLRGLGTACATPIRFSLLSGHASSARRSRAVDSRGEPMPWLTYPAIDLLRAKQLMDRTVLEFGASESTLWFTRHTASVLSFESDASWQRHVTSQLPANTRVHVLPSTLEGIGAYLEPGQRFDLVLVDGMERATAAAYARDLEALSSSTTPKVTGDRRPRTPSSTSSEKPASCA